MKNFIYRTTFGQYKSYQNKITVPDPIEPDASPNVPGPWELVGSTAGEGMVLFWFWRGEVAP